MALYVSNVPMTKGAFDALLAGMAWKREGGTAFDRYHGRVEITDIDKVKAEDGTQRILFNGGDLRAYPGFGCFVDQDDALFQSLLGTGSDEDD